MRYIKTLLIVFFSLVLIISLILIIKTGNSEISNSHPSEKTHLSPQQEPTEKGMETPIDTKYLLGKFDPAQEPDFVEIDKIHTDKRGLYLRDEAYKAFVKMYDASLKDGINLSILSATRNFNSQKFIWERKWKGETLVEGKNLAKTENDPVERAKIILKFSSMPGTSRHHWGTDLDLNALNNDYFSTEQGKKIFDWLQKNASEYGFCQTYTPKNSSRPTGYEEEKWHWSYLPLARSFLAQYIQKVRYEDLSGFMGWETAKELRVIQHYVLGISNECR